MKDSPVDTSDRGKFLPKTTAKDVYCLSEKDLSPLKSVEKRNPRFKKGAPMKLFELTALEEVALEKWGGQDGLELERQRRIDKRQKRAQEAEELGDQKRARLDEPALTDQAGLANQEPAAVADCQQTGQGASAAELAAPAAASPTAGVPSTPVGVGCQKELSSWVTERIRNCRTASTSQRQQSAPGSGEFVLYWMNTALRGHENPALDVARAEAHAMGLPLVATAFLLDSHTYPTARRYQFVLQGLADTQQELRPQGVELLVYLEGFTQHLAGHRASASSSQSAGSRGWQALLELAARAQLVVTEEMPVAPERGWLEDMVKQLDAAVPVWAVDTACIIPMKLLGKAHEKAYAFRSAVEKPKKARLASMPYRDNGRDFMQLGLPQPDGSSGAASQQQQHRRSFVPDNLGWESIDLCAPGVDVTAMIRQCQGLDHSVAAVSHLRGGSRAGYTRWSTFLRKGLPLYAAKRNSPMIRDGVSRMSAYHHYGMVSPFKIARDALAQRSTGSGKFVDEFLTWRELAFAFCFFRWPELESLKAVSKWAQTTLLKHAKDPRSLKTQEELEVGRTGDALWDAMQHQLATTGELHNNARMTWGKALLLWTPDPETALKQTIHLNHKFALDGCDPCSYAGILWCYGQFDGPKGSDSTPIYGSLRMRPTSSISKRLDPAAYRQLAVKQDGSAEREPAQKAIESFFRPAGRKNPACADASDVQ
ncbi:hypothetical protein WJX72_002689 [[Myrmecia] bisecta]|uniref:Photolyase/cryptochrome alpha/beta domain-containing protein n=1 Tax=[Myrmecia] bisecta TaxID=41462 RepID=A0AAW1Q677_9CHLO